MRRSVRVCVCASLFCVWVCVCTHVPMLLWVSVHPLWKNQLQSYGCKNLILTQEIDRHGYERLHYVQRLGGSVRGQSACPVPRAIRMSSRAREDDPSCYACTAAAVWHSDQSHNQRPWAKCRSLISSILHCRLLNRCNFKCGINLTPVFLTDIYC